MGKPVRRMGTPEALEALETVQRRLADTGSLELAETMERALEALRDERGVHEPTGGVMTTGQAAQVLGVRSVNTIKRWAREGLLEGFRRGGRVLVSRRSVEHLIGSPSVAEQRAFEHRLDEDLGGFGDDKAPELPLNATWRGRRPWDQHVSSRA